MNKLKDLFDISNQIITAYSNLIPLTEIKNLVIEEYMLMQTISLEEVDYYIETIANYTYNDDNPVISRIKNKLIECKELLEGNFINSNTLNITSIPNEMKFSIYDTIMSMITIDTINHLTKKIYSTIPTCEQDEIFINILKEKLEIFKINFLYNNSTSEIIALSNEFNTDHIPSIDINIIKRSINELNISVPNTIIEEIALYYSKNAINSLIDIIKNLKNNPSSIFIYLTLTTQLEILNTYLNENMSKKIEEYFSTKVSNINNKFIIGYVKKIIKSKKKN